MFKQVAAAVGLVIAGFAPGSATAGAVFITGHDPDYHAQGGAGAARLLQTGLNFVTGGTWNTPGHKFLWVESNNPVSGGHLFGTNALVNNLGLVAGVNFDQVNASGLSAVNFSNYTAIAVASSFGGMLTQAEINALIARKSDIAAFVNAGHGLFASSECGFGFSNCDASNITNNSSLFGFLPVTATSVSQTPPFTITAFGTMIGAPFGLTTGDLQDPTHNSFAPIVGLNPVDLDATGSPTTLAGDTGIGDGGFIDVPEPASIGLLGFGLIAFAFKARRKAGA